MAEKEIKKQVADVEKPGTTPAPATSRPVIIGQGPRVKDPMVNENTPEIAEQATPTPLPSTKKKTIQPLSEQPKEATTEPKPEVETPPESSQPAESEVAPDAAPTEEADKPDATDTARQISEEERKHQELVDKLVAEKKYFVSIGAATKRRTARNTIILFVAFVSVLGGALLAVDAELIQTNITLPFDLIK